MTALAGSKRAPASAQIELEGIGRRYEVGAVRVTALEGVDLQIEPGEFIVVLGPSGSGKTTLLNMIGALDAPTSETVSFIFQTFNLFPALSARENVEFGADAAGRERPREVAAEMLERVGLADRLVHFPHELSGGEQQRVAIARALATGNPVLLADEPTGELDFRTGVSILELLHEQTHVAGTTVIVVTHNREISRVAHRVIELSSGRVVSDQEPADGPADISTLHW